MIDIKKIYQETIFYLSGKNGFDVSHEIYDIMFDVLCRTYSERAYHNMEHIKNILLELETHKPKLKKGEYEILVLYDGA